MIFLHFDGRATTHLLFSNGAWITLHASIALYTSGEIMGKINDWFLLQQRRVAGEAHEETGAAATRFWIKLARGLLIIEGSLDSWLTWYMVFLLRRTCGTWCSRLDGLRPLATFPCSFWNFLYYNFFNRLRCGFGQALL